jgi:UDP-N-acetylglucosamine transferase subunit ALG13
VSLGTIKPFRFDRLIDRLLGILEPQDLVVWQVGCTTRTDLPGEVHDYLARDRFRDLAAESDAVIAQAGAGGLLDLLEMGVSPIVAPRRAAFGEHVDDHQLQAARAFAKLGLILSKEVAELSRSDLLDRPSAVRGQRSADQDANLNQFKGGRLAGFRTESAVPSGRSVTFHK